MHTCGVLCELTHHLQEAELLLVNAWGCYVVLLLFRKYITIFQEDGEKEDETEDRRNDEVCVHHCAWHASFCHFLFVVLFLNFIAMFMLICFLFFGEIHDHAAGMVSSQCIAGGAR